MEQTDPDKIIFRFLKPGCDKMSGPLLLHAEVGCCNEWCAGTSTWTINSLKQGFFEINRLIPYSNYTVDISAGRKESNQGLMFFHSQSFQTYPKRESFKQINVDNHAKATICRSKSCKRPIGVLKK